MVEGLQVLRGVVIWRRLHNYFGKTVYGHLKFSLADDGLVSISKCEESEALQTKGIRRGLHEAMRSFEMI